MNSKRIGFIGFGEAAYLISSGFVTEGYNKIIAYDVNQNQLEIGEKIRDRAAILHIPLMDSLQDLVENCDIIISATSAKYALSVAKEALPYLNRKQLFVDMNAASPMVKETMDELLKGHAQFVDVAVVESIPNFQHKVPLLVSGSGSGEFETFGKSLHMNMTYINEKAGSASAIKMIRSVFMKGLTSLLIETLCASDKYGVNDLIMDSLEKSLLSKPLAETANLLINRTAIHAERRVAEMKEVVKTLEALEVDPSLSKATKTKLEMYVDIDLKNHFTDQEPNDYNEVIKKINELYPLR